MCKETTTTALSLTPGGIVVANLMPLAGVLWLGWDAFGLLVLYWMESLVIAAFAALTIVRRHPLTGPFQAIFFLCLFSGFSALHGLFLLLLFGQGEGDIFSDEGEPWPGPLFLLQLLTRVIVQVAASAPELFYWPLLALVVAHAIAYRGEAAVNGTEEETRELIWGPMRRIGLMHTAIISGGIAAGTMANPFALLAGLVLLKLFLELHHYRRKLPAGRGMNP